MTIFSRLRLALSDYLFSIAVVMFCVFPSPANAQSPESSEVLFCETTSNLSIRDGVASPQANIKFAINLRGNIMRLDLNSQLINWLEGRKFWESYDFIGCLMDKNRDPKQKCPMGEETTTELSVYRPDVTMGTQPQKAGFTFSLNDEKDVSLFMKLDGYTGNLTMVNAKQLQYESLIKTAYANCVGVEEF